MPLNEEAPQAVMPGHRFRSKRSVWRFRAQALVCVMAAPLAACGAPAESDTEALVGRWESDDALSTLELREDGTFTFRDVPLSPSGPDCSVLPGDREDLDGTYSLIPVSSGFIYMEQGFQVWIHPNLLSGFALVVSPCLDEYPPTAVYHKVDEE